jgi:hypothetical protein
MWPQSFFECDRGAKAGMLRQNPAVRQLPLAASDGQNKIAQQKVALSKCSDQMSHTISNSLDLIVEGYSSGCEIEENEDDQYIVWDDKFNCDSESEASNYSDDSDDPSQMLTVTKKEKMLNKLEGAREAKRRKTEAQQNFAELFDEGEVLTNKSDIFKFCLRERCKNYNIICIDSTTSFINESVPEKV